MLLLIGYGVGRWQDTPASSEAAPAAPSAAVPSAAPPTVATTTTPPPKPTVYPTLQAESASALNGIQVQDTTDEGGGKNAGFIATGDSMRFDNVDFGAVPATKLLVRVAAGTADGGRMEIHPDSPDQAAAGVLTVENTGGWQNWQTDEVTLTSPLTGTHTVYFTFTGNQDSEFVNVNWLRFEH